MGSVKDIINAVAKGEMTAAEAEAKADAAWSQAQAQIAESLATAASDIFGEAQQTIRASFQSSDPMVRKAWAYVVWSQTTVLLWYQVGLPVYVKIFGGSFPRTGDDLLQWAYALVGGALGIGMIGGAKDAVAGMFKSRR
ncbi:hypothetical protein [Roseibium sp. Sym1]|uniref:hypothetical protein n=1 Tax=Roseibium sp. Sym1 TaxID=3016006 RepID=UPI0022B2F5F3|nr:hypothetical protein [Roseibium sp. Sym1]